MATVSIVIPTYNSAAFLGQALRSVFAQTYQDFEVIVVDDGSTDETEVQSKNFGDRVISVRQEHRGPGAARNLGILHTQGEFVAFLDADDLWLPEKLAKQVEYMGCHPDVVLAYTDFSRGEDPRKSNGARLSNYRHKGSGHLFSGLLRENFVATPSVLVRRHALAASGLFDPTLTGAEDRDLWLRLARVGPFGLIDEVLVLVRNHPGNTMKTIQFARDQARAYGMMLARYSDEAEPASLLRQNLGDCYWNLAYAERLEGNYREAAKAYRAASKLGCHRFGAGARFLLMRLPKPILGLLGCVTRVAGPC
jgi:glycosyltransferase involved in cell wall biosynthesis